MAKDDLGKELIQCLAFAHFAVEPYKSSNEDEHMQSFYDLFDPENKPTKKTIRLYTRYLSNGFDFDRIYDNWKGKVSQKDGLKNVSTDITVKIVYDVAKEFFKSNNISRNFSQYEFVDQKDPFMHTIKEEALSKILKAMKLSFKPDILSSADIYIVKKTEKRKILAEFNNEIMKKNDLYLINNFDKYNQILIKHWKQHNLFGVSLKLPTSNQAKNIKIVGVPDDVLNKKMKKKLDPFTKFLSLLSDPNTNVKKLIDDTIEIKRYNISGAAWDFPYIFKYKQLNLYPSDVTFVLQAWPKAQTAGGGSAGFNGKFDKNIQGYSTQWVGGTGIKTLEDFISQYSEYNRIMSELSSIRQKALNYAITGSASKRPNINQEVDAKMKINFPMKMKTTEKTKSGKLKSKTLKGQVGAVDYGKGGQKTGTMKVKNLQSFYASAVRELKRRGLNIGTSRNEKLVNFFEEYEKATGEVDMMKKYQQAVINLCTKTSAGRRIDQSDSMLNTFYEHSQLSYYMLRGGAQYIKKKIFLTVFGVITKKGYNIVKDSDLNSSKLVNAIRVNASKALIKEIKSFDTVPHFYMS